MLADWLEGAACPPPPSPTARASGARPSSRWRRLLLTASCQRARAWGLEKTHARVCAGRAVWASITTHRRTSSVSPDLAKVSARPIIFELDTEAIWMPKRRGPVFKRFCTGSVAFFSLMKVHSTTARAKCGRRECACRGVACPRCVAALHCGAIAQAYDRPDAGRGRLC